MEDDKEMLEDLIAAAFNDAVRRAEELQKEKMASVTAGMPLPPGNETSILIHRVCESTRSHIIHLLPS